MPHNPLPIEFKPGNGGELGKKGKVIGNWQPDKLSDAFGERKGKTGAFSHVFRMRVHFAGNMLGYRLIKELENELMRGGSDRGRRAAAAGRVLFGGNETASGQAKVAILPQPSETVRRQLELAGMQLPLK